MTAFKEGQRNSAIWILSNIEQFPELYIQFLTEERDVRDIQEGISNDFADGILTEIDRYADENY